jgi:hypothetical protein
MEIDEILDIIRPLPENRDLVLSWLSGNGVVDVEDRGDALFVRTTVGVARKLFDTTFNYFHHPALGKTIVRQMGTFGIPSHLDNHIDFVSGISEFPVPKYAVKKTP